MSDRQDVGRPVSAVGHTEPAAAAEVPSRAAPGGGRVGVLDILRMLQRRWRVISACTLVALALAAAILRSDKPQYQAVATIRIDDREPNLLNIYRANSPSLVATEIMELGSRSLVEDSVRTLALQVRLTAPARFRSETSGTSARAC